MSRRGIANRYLRPRNLGNLPRPSLAQHQQLSNREILAQFSSSETHRLHTIPIPQLVTPPRLQQLVQQVKQPKPIAQKSKLVTSHEVYTKKLFDEGFNSDITIEFVNETFQGGKMQMKSHKLMLMQLPYFEALFGAHWNEANKETIQIIINDDNITERSLELIFKSLYTGRLDYQTTEEDFISIMATGRMFNLDDAANIVSKEMIATVEMNNVIDFYYSFESYGFPELSSQLLRWILRHFSYWYEFEHNDFCSQVLSRIDVTLLETIITHVDFIAKNELTIYSIVKRWTVDKMKMKDGYDFFKTWNRSQPFLETADGKEFERIYSLLIVDRLLMDADALEMLKKDNFYPETYLHRAGAENFLNLAKLSGVSSSTKSSINDQCYRLGIFHKQAATVFQVTSFNYFGIYLNFGWNDNTLTVQRNMRNKETLFNHAPITIRFRIVFCSPGKFHEDTFQQDSGYVEYEVLENELVNLMKLKSDEGSNCIRVTTEQIPTISQLSHNRLMPDYNDYNLLASFPYSPYKAAQTRPQFPKIIFIEMSFKQSKTEICDDVQMIDG